MYFMLVRHADPDYANDSLTDRGCAEATRFGASLAGMRFALVASSPMGRAQMTMRLALQNHEYDPVVLPWLRELEGRYDGSRWAWNTSAQDLADDPERAAQIEAFMAEQTRAVRASFDELLLSFGFERDGAIYRNSGAEVSRARSDVGVIAFCHEGLMKTLVSEVLGWPLAAVYSRTACPPLARTALRLEMLDSTIAQIRAGPIFQPFASPRSAAE